MQSAAAPVLRCNVHGYLDFLYFSHYCRRAGGPTIDSVRFVVDDTDTHVDLSTRPDLTAGVLYRIRVIAVNNIGESNRSNEVEYSRLGLLICVCLSILNVYLTSTCR